MAGKKQKNEIEILSISIPVRYSIEQHNDLKKRASRVGKGVSTYIRLSSLKSVWNVTSKTDKETLAQIRKIGVNVNQITHKINSIGVNEFTLPLINEIKSLKEELYSLHSKIK